MYITHLAALSLSSADNVHTQPPLKAPETRGGTIQTLTGTLPLALARLERRLGAEVCMCTCACVYMCRCVGAQLTAPVPTTYTPSRLSKRLRHAGVCIDTHRNTSIGSRSFGKASWGRRCVCVRAQVCICVGA